MVELDTLTKRVGKLVSELQTVRVRCREETQALEQVRARLTAIEEAQAFAQQVAQTVQQQAHERIAGVVSRSLEAVFDEPYTFRINFERKRGRTEAKLVFERGGLEVDPMTASGGGVVDVAAFALRLSCLMLSRPPLRRLLVLDEPFKYVSAIYQPQVRKLLETLAEEMGVQIIMVTHIEGLKTGSVVQL